MILIILLMFLFDPSSTYSIMQDGGCLNHEIALVECSGRENQSWSIRKLGDGHYIRNEWTRECITAHKSNVKMSRCKMNESQTFAIEAAWFGDGIVIKSSDGLCLDNDSEIFMNHCHGLLNQQWGIK